MLTHLKKADFWIYLASWNLPDFPLCLKSKKKLSVLKAQNYVGGGGGHCTDKMYTGRGNTAYTFMIRRIIGVGTQHNIERKSFAADGGSRLDLKATLWLHLSSLS